VFKNSNLFRSQSPGNLRCAPCLWGRIIGIQITLASVYLYKYQLFLQLTFTPTL